MMKLRVENLEFWRFVNNQLSSLICVYKIGRNNDSYLLSEIQFTWIRYMSFNDFVNDGRDRNLPVPKSNVNVFFLRWTLSVFLKSFELSTRCHCLFRRHTHTQKNPYCCLIHWHIYSILRLFFRIFFSRLFFAFFVFHNSDKYKYMKLLLTLMHVCVVNAHEQRTKAQIHVQFNYRVKWSLQAVHHRFISCAFFRYVYTVI